MRLYLLPRSPVLTYNLAASLHSSTRCVYQHASPFCASLSLARSQHLRRLRVNTGALVRTELTFDAEAAQRRIDADESVLASLNNIFQLSLATEATLLQPGQASGRAFFTRRTKTTKPIAVIFFEEMELDGTVIRCAIPVSVPSSPRS